MKVTECNNEGALVFSYDLEDIDHLESGANIFNGQDSVFWSNLRDAFYDRIKSMYQTLRSNGALSYAKVDRMFDEHQSKWPEAIFNEDQWFKHLAPLVEKGNASYLSMVQGSKKSQRKWWLYNRFKYLDSKYNAGDSLNDYIELRGYAKGDITVTPYASIYATIKYGSYLVQTRAQAGQSYLLACPLDTLNDTEIAIYSCSQLKSVGNLSALKIGRANFSSASKIQDIILGSADQNYSNGNLTELALGNNTLLKLLDVRNCPNLTQPVDASNCPNIEQVYLTGTSVTGASFPNGGILKKIHLPGTLANLTIRNQKKITEFNMPSYSNISTLRLENVSSVIPVFDILDGIQSSARVRLVGFAWEMDDTDEIADFYDLLDTFRGLDENGGNTDKAQVFASIHLESARGDALATLKARYPSISITADYSECALIYKDDDGVTLHTETIVNGADGTWDGTSTKAEDNVGIYTFVGWNTTQHSETADASATLNVTEDRVVYAAFSVRRKRAVRYHDADGELWYTETVLNGNDAVYSQSPTKESTAQYSYAFAGWSLTSGGSASATAQQNITADTDLFPVYASTVRTYTATFVRASADGGGTLYTQNNVPYGTAPTYGGSTPTTTQGDATDYPFEGWTPALAGITGNTTYTAKFGSPIDVSQISDTWDQLIAKIDSGAYKTAYKTGQYLTLDLGTEGTHDYQIHGIDEDEDALGDKIPLTFLPKSTVLSTTRVWNGSQKTYDGSTSYTAGGWEHSDMRNSINTIIMPLVPSNVRNRMVAAKKIQSTLINGSKVTDGQTTYDKGWIPSHHEIFGSNTYETQGAKYSKLYPDRASRVKTRNGSLSYWWLRSVYNASNARCVDGDGNDNYSIGYVSSGVAFGFCLGTYKQVHMRNVTLAEVVAARDAGTLDQLLSVGDIIPLDLGTEGAVCLQLVGFNKDDKTDGSGKATVTFVTYHVLNTAHRWNPSLAGSSPNYTVGTGTIGGYPESELCDYLENTIWPILPEVLRNAVVEVTKGCPSYNESGGSTTFNYDCKIWPLSYNEMFGSSDSVGQPSYNAVFNSDGRRKKTKVGASAGSSFWLRSASGANGAYSVNRRGSDIFNSVSNSDAVAFGLCI